MDHTFCRLLYNKVKEDIPKEIKLRSIWSYRFFRDDWEVQGPNGLYWNGSAHCSWDAKAKAIMRWFSK